MVVVLWVEGCCARCPANAPENYSAAATVNPRRRCDRWRSQHALAFPVLLSRPLSSSQLSSPPPPPPFFFFPFSLRSHPLSLSLPVLPSLTPFRRVILTSPRSVPFLFGFSPTDVKPLAPLRGESFRHKTHIKQSGWWIMDAMWNFIVAL